MSAPSRVRNSCVAGPVGWVKYDSFDMAEQRATQDGIIVDEAIVPLLSTCEDFEMYARRYPISSLAISRLAVAMKELKQEDSVLVAVKAQYANVREGKQTPARRAFKTFAKLIPPGPSSAPLPHVLPKRLKFLKPKVCGVLTKVPFTNTPRFQRSTHRARRRPRLRPPPKLPVGERRPSCLQRCAAW